MQKVIVGTYKKGFTVAYYLKGELVAKGVGKRISHAVSMANNMKRSLNGNTL